MAAGNWTTGAGIGDANIAVATRTIQAAIHTSVKNLEVIGHPVIMDMLMRDEGLGPMLGALGVSVGLADIGQGKLTAVAEGTEATATNFALSNSTTVTPARKAYARKVSDFARSVQESLLRGELGPNAQALIAYEAYRLWANALINDIVALAPSASNAIGTTGTALTWGALSDGVYDLKNRGAASGPALALISVKGAKDLADDALSLGGAVQMAGQIQQLIPNAGNGAYLGRYFGSLDIYLNSEIDASGGDDFGLLLTNGAVLSKHQAVPLPGEADVLVNSPMFSVEMRRPGGGITTFETVSHNAVAALEQGRMACLQYLT